MTPDKYTLEQLTDLAERLDGIATARIGYAEHAERGLDARGEEYAQMERALASAYLDAASALRFSSAALRWARAETQRERARADAAEDRADAAETLLQEAVEKLGRLASGEAFGVSRSLDPHQDHELLLRMEYAKDAFRDLAAEIRGRG